MRYAALPPAPHLNSVLSQWRLDPVMLAVVAVAAIGYGVGLVRARRAGNRWPAGRVIVFYVAGIGSLALVGMGWPAVYAPELFSVYATQMIVLLIVTPFLLALGHPLGLVKAALGPTGVARLDRVLGSRGLRVLTVPVVSPILLAIVPYVLFFTPLLDLSLRHGVVLALVRVGLVLTGLVVLIPMWEADAIGLRWPYAVALLFAFIELLVDAVPGIVVRLQTHLLAAGYFTTLARPWGPKLLVDQHLGGDILWCVGEAIDVPFLALLVWQWVRSDARDAARADRELDAAAAIRLQAAGNPADNASSAPADARAAVPAEPDDGMQRPWWETEASVFGNRSGEFQRRSGTD